MTRHLLVRIGVLAVTASLAACGGDEEPTAEAPETTPAPAAEEAHWSYTGAEGPERWGELSEEFEACGSGREQSPINLTRAERSDLRDVEFDYKPAAYQIVNTGHTVQANTENAGGITLDGKPYNLIQFHTHIPSEHTIEGEAADVGLHLVHQNDAGKLAVVGVLMSEGDAGALDEVWNDLPAEGETSELSSFDPSSLIPEDTRSFRYDGSLTTPPCTEGVEWIVMRDTTTVVPDIVSELEEMFESNARPVQELNGRVLEMDTKAG